jgi:hypothetical protein
MLVVLSPELTESERAGPGPTEQIDELPVVPIRYVDRRGSDGPRDERGWGERDDEEEHAEPTAAERPA